MKILDATCGSKSIWYMQKHPFVVFMDKRNKDYQDPRMDRYFVHRFNPTILAKWENTPFKDNTFDIIVFDPPHLIKNRDNKEIHLVKKYGCLYSDNWKSVLRDGIKDLFRSLKNNGVFIFKWCDNSISLAQVLKLFPYRPLFSTKTGQKNHTHWVLFLKYRLEKELNIL